MDLEEILINEDKMTYKCFDELKRLLREDENFRNLIIKGINENKVMGFPSELWDKIKSQNIRGIPSFETIFKEGINIGGCTKVSEQLSYSFPYCYLCGGILPILIGTKNCPKGEHSWISYERKVIDTTLMLIINEDYSIELGYKENFRYDPSINSFYLTTKEFTNDHNLRRG